MSRLPRWTAPLLAHPYTELRELLDAIPPDADELKVGNYYYSLVFNEREREGLYGHAYRFSLADAVDDVTEWIVYWKEFEE